MTKRFTFWNDGEFWLGYLDEYPDYLTQGNSFEDLKEHLKDIYNELSGGKIPFIRKSGELELA